MELMLLFLLICAKLIDVLDFLVIKLRPLLLLFVVDTAAALEDKTLFFGLNICLAFEVLTVSIFLVLAFFVLDFLFFLVSTSVFVYVYIMSSSSCSAFRSSSSFSCLSLLSSHSFFTLSISIYFI